MCQMISILVDKAGKVYAVDGEHSHSQIAARCGVNEDKCLKYEFILSARQLRQDFDMDCAPFPAKQSHDMAAQAFFDKAAGTPKKLMAFVRRGNFEANYLSALLTDSAQGRYEKADEKADKACEQACNAAEHAYDKTIQGPWKAYLTAAPGRAAQNAHKAYEAAKDKADKQNKKACAKAEKAYDDALQAAWLKLFANPKNRIPIWRR